MASLIVMSYAEIVLAIVPDAPPTRKNQRATSCPAPISANVPYLFGSRLIWSAFCSVPGISRVIAYELFTKLSLRRARKELRPELVGERGPLACCVRRLAGDSAVGSAVHGSDARTWNRGGP